MGAVGSALAGGGFFFVMFELGSFWDGPGVGLFGQQSSAVFLPVWLAGAAAWVVGAWGVRNARWAGKSFLLGLLTYVLLLLSGAGQRLYGHVQARRCLAGSDQDCYAAGGSYRSGTLRTSRERERGNELFLRGCELDLPPAAAPAAMPAVPRGVSWSSNCCRRLLEQDTLSPDTRGRACRGLAAVCRLDTEGACRRLAAECGEARAAPGDLCASLRKGCQGAESSCRDLERFRCTGTDTTPTARRPSPGPAEQHGYVAWVAFFNSVPLALILASLIGTRRFRRRAGTRLRTWAGGAAGMWLVLLVAMHGRGVVAEDVTPMIVCREATGGLRLEPAASAGPLGCSPVHPRHADLGELRRQGVVIARIADPPEVARLVVEAQPPRAGFVPEVELAAVQTTALLVSSPQGLVSHQYRIVAGQVRDVRVWPLSPLRPSSWLCWLAAMCLVPLTVRVVARAAAEAHPTLARTWIAPLAMGLAFVSLVAFVWWRRGQIVGSIEGLHDPYDDARFNAEVWRAWNEKSIAWPLYQGETAPRAFMSGEVGRTMLATRPTSAAVIRMLGLPSWRVPHEDGRETLLYHIGWWQWIDGPFLSITVGRDDLVETVGRTWSSSGAKGGYLHGGPYDDGSGLAEQAAQGAMVPAQRP